ncbi:succinate dehydrogenase cytochrome b subunit, partial [bacterium]|nr:succinate dehydrogenase cytochrome b subunit [bacterium]
MNRALAIYHSSIGKKAIMAVTGMIGIAFVIGHMVGNLQVFQGAEKLNAYAALIRQYPALLYFARAVLLGAVILHIVAAYQLSRMSWQSRSQSYERWEPVASDYASRTMRWSGPILLLFIIYHLLDFTFGTVNPDFRHGDVFHNVISSFTLWYVTAFYVVSMLALGLHMYHGIWSMFQSLGLNNPKYNQYWKNLAVIITGIVVIGNIAMPLAVFFGFV